MLLLEVIKSDPDSKSICLDGEIVWREEVRRNIRPSRSVRRTTSRRATTGAALAAKKLSAAHGQPSISQTRAAGKEAGEVAGKSGANRARAKVGEQAAANKSLTIAKDTASIAMSS